MIPTTQHRSCCRRAVPGIAVLLVVLTLTVTLGVAGQKSAARPEPAFSVDGRQSPLLPQDRGVAGLRQELLRLRTTARLLHTTAHPDDEDGGMLTLQSRGHGASVTLLTLNRGEGGQNRMGSNLLDVLGGLRTLELLAADHYYGVEQRFTRAADFGFSKSAEETFAKWHGTQPVLADMVRVIRTFRPDVIVSRFQGTPKDGHGHHEAAGILTREAFRAAADPTLFPDQIREGLLPWQAKKLYIDNVRPPWSTEAPPADAFTLALDTGAEDPRLGMSYLRFAMEGLRHQLSQGAGSWEAPPGPHISYYRLLDSVLPMPAAGQHEKDFFDGIDTTLAGLAARLGGEEKKVPWLRPALKEIANKVDQASAAAEGIIPFPEPAQSDVEKVASAAPLLGGLAETNELIERVNGSSLSQAAKNDLLANLATKAQQFQRAANLALNVAVDARLEAPIVPDAEHQPVAVPGQNIAVTVNASGPVEWRHITLEMPAGWKAKSAKKADAKAAGRNPTDADQKMGASASVSVSQRLMSFLVGVPEDAQLTRPYWHRSNPETETLYIIDRPEYATLPFSPPPLHARAEYTFNGLTGVVRVPVTIAIREESGGRRELPLAVAPAFSVSLAPATRVLPLADQQKPVQVAVGVRANVAGTGDLRIEVPPAWSAEPPLERMTASAPGDFNSSFEVTPRELREQRYELKAAVYASAEAKAKGKGGPKRYAEGYTVITRPDLGAFFYYQPAVQHASVVDVKVPAGLKVGYIMGAGDDLPTILRQTGLEVTLLSDQDLATGDLNQFGTIVVGIRAYDTRAAVREHNQRLLDYVSAGGTLVVQYNANIGQFNSGRYTPYPAEVGRDRVTVEEAPVEILSPQDSIFHYPNQISARDFQNWVQERGLYFMVNWDPKFEPLLASHDPGTPALSGGLLRAHYGKGIYIYTSYAFFRQLPAGVPGAVRLFVNLVSAGHEPQAFNAFNAVKAGNTETVKP